MLPSSPPFPVAPGAAGLPAPSPVSRRLFQLSGVDESRALLSSLYEVTTLEPSRSGAMSGELELTSMGAVNVVKTSWNDPWRSISPLIHSSYAVCLAQQGRGRGVHGKAAYEIVPGVAGGVYSPGASVEFEAQAGYQGRALTIGREDLEAHFQLLTGRPLRESMRFEPALDLTSKDAAAFMEIARLFRAELGRPEASPFILNALRNAFFSALLTSFKHSASSLLEAPPERIAPRSVRLAEEYIAAHAAEPITLADVARAAEVSMRSLQIAFKTHRGTTPMQLLRDRRFELARERLLAAAPGTRVAAVVASVGVGGTTGRFSVEYGKRFGESPSQTLRRAQGPLRPAWRSSS